ncbi:MAG: DUF1460 domain-containing protein [Calditrichaceae bacterium]
MSFLTKVFIYLVIVFSVSPDAFIYGQPAKRFHQMSHVEIDELIRQTAKTAMTVTGKMNFYSAFFLDMPYNIHCVGDGPYALYEPWPLVNFNETNCMAFCEHVLALSISDNWDNFFNNLQQIRYKDGLIGMKTRNHYTMADWLPQNSWLLEDVTAKVGGSYTKKVTRTISHRQFFADKGISDTTYTLPDRTLTIEYIPLNDFEKIINQTKVGDILSLLFAKLDNIFSAHMVMVVNDGNGKLIRESSNSKMITFDTPIQEWIEQKINFKSQRYLGLTVMRIREDINSPGRIINPANIKKIKNNYE